MEIQQAIEHARKVAEEKYTEGMLCHANPNDDELDECIKCAKEHEQLAHWLEELQAYQSIGTIEECRNAREKQTPKKPIRIDMCTCPKCGTYNETIKKRRNTVQSDIVYCWHCGQAMEIKRSDID